MPRYHVTLDIPELDGLDPLLVVARALERDARERHYHTWRVTNLETGDQYDVQTGNLLNGVGARVSLSSYGDK